jgi:predicted transport protein
MFTYENSIKEFGNTLASLIEITKCEALTGIIYLQECNKEKKQKLYISYTLENVLSCISKNQLQWKKLSVSVQQLELNKYLLNNLY